MKCHIQLSRKNKKRISKCHLLKFLPSVIVNMVTIKILNIPRAFIRIIIFNKEGGGRSLRTIRKA